MNRAESSLALPRWPPASRLAAAGARRLVLSRLEKIRHGVLTVEDGREIFQFGDSSSGGPAATIRTRHPRFYTSLLFGGSVGAGESYMRGEWTCDRLTDLVRLMVRNRDALEGVESGLARIYGSLLRAAHRLRRNTRRGSRRNISAHYDLGNEFYELFLDSTMSYSCALFEDSEASLEAASVAKIDRICRKLDLSPRDHVLEIGTGWGGWARHAAVNYGCRVTTATISRRQWEYSRRKIEAAGLSNRVEVLFSDYRDLEGVYDKLVSVEMVEAVGHHYLDLFFRRCADLLRPEGTMLLQAITIADQNYERARDSVDFVKRHIFPGSFIPSVTALCHSMTRASDLRLVHLEDLTPHYARTLKEWRKRFNGNLAKVRQMGFSEEFIRMWEFYLCYCEGGFAERAIGDVQMLLGKPLCRDIFCAESIQRQGEPA